MKPVRFLGVVATILFVATAPTRAADRSRRELERGFTEIVHPFLQTYCFGCHGAEKQKGKLDLRPYSTLTAVAGDYRRWETISDKLKSNEMPPEEARKHPAPELRKQVLDWIQAMRRHEAWQNAGDPGLVLARRLSNAEYDYTIRDLTGVDIRPAREFPVDPANEAGFDNSGESLAMSPALVTKYLEAARSVSEHLVLLPDGFVFAPHPVVTESDRDKYGVKRIIDFYQRQSTNYVDYFLAAWRFKHRATLGRRGDSLTEIAAASGISPKYLATIWSTLTGVQEEAGPIAALQMMWRQLPVPSEKLRGTADAPRRECERMGDFVQDFRLKLRPEYTNLSVRGIAPGSQPFVLWKDQQFAADRLRCRADALSRLQGDPPGHELAGKTCLVPADAAGRARFEAGLRRFCAIFPDAFYVPERGLIFLKEDKESQGRLLSAGFHLMTGYLRDDAPLSTLMLDESAQRELDRLWDEFHFITLDAIRQYKDYIFFERAEPPRFMQGAEFDFARSEDKDCTSKAKMDQLAEAYMAKARRSGGTGAAIEAIEDHFKASSRAIRQIEQARLAAEPKHFQALLNFAERAYRRPLSKSERGEWLAFNRTLREKDGLNHEEALRDTIVSVLMSPSFCYRLDSGRDSSATPPREPGASGWKSAPLSDDALASRLSYFLWSSMPDSELFAHARAGDLHRPKVLLAQTRRMLQDGRSRGFATEFGGNWLDFRRFEEHNAVDRERFKTFDPELRSAMFEEPIHFFIDVIRRDRSVLDFLNASDTFVNPVLARHYGLEAFAGGSNQWKRVPDARPFGRGGLLPMSVFLTKNAPGLRTSPVKRGYWVVRRLLGEQIPPPPPNVPELPADEGKLGDLTLREVLARHRADKNCAGCHARFDGIGVAFEGYGPIGERRDRDLGGHPIDTRAIFPGGSEGAGLDGLRVYLNESRRQEFIDNLCRKMLAYALGRTLMLSDDVTLDDMRSRLAANGHRFSSVVEAIVLSPQFLTRRVSGDRTTR